MRTRMSRNTRDFLTCGQCGAALARGESCNCQQPVEKPWLHASCPYFHHRGSYGGESFIVCQAADKQTFIRNNFDSAAERNAAYVMRCCEGRACLTRGRETAYAQQAIGRGGHKTWIPESLQRQAPPPKP